MIKIIKDNSYFTVHGWMIKDLHLKGNELLVYAIIYGFSQDGQGCFNGSQSYLAEFTNSTARGIRKNLSSLIEQDLITKSDRIVNGVKYCEYIINEEFCSSGVRNKVPRGTEQSSSGVRNKVPRGTEQSSDNIIDNTITNIIDNNKGKKPYDDILNKINNDSLKESLKDYIDMRKSLKKPLTNRALELAISKLNKLSSNVEEQIEIVNTAIINSWLSFYPLKDNKPQQNNFKPQQINSFNNFNQRNYSNDELSELEKKLLNR